MLVAAAVVCLEELLTLPPRNRRTLPSRQRTYIRLRARVDRLEDAISHFYNVITELRSRVSTLEKELKPLAKSCLVVREEFRSH